MQKGSSVVAVKNMRNLVLTTGRAETIISARTL